MITIHPATLRDMTYIAGNMRAADRREIHAVIQESDTVIGAMLFAGSPDLAWTAWDNDGPVCAFGIAAMFKGTGSGWAYGTRRMRTAMPTITKFLRRVVKPLLIEQGFRRVEVRTAIDHDLSHAWLSMLGFRLEGIARDYGDGLDFCTYAATRSDDARHSLLRQQDHGVLR